MPSRSWEELHRAQLEVRAAPQPTGAMQPNQTRLDEYVLTYELVLEGEAIATWSGALEYGPGDGPGDHFPNVQLWTAKPAALPTAEQAAGQLSLRAFAVRGVAGKPVRVVQLFEGARATKKDETTLGFDAATLPHNNTATAMAELIGCHTRVVACPGLDTESGLLKELFSLEAQLVWTAPSALLDGSASSASLDHLQARALPAHPRVPSEQRGSSVVAPAALFRPPQSCARSAFRRQAAQETSVMNSKQILTYLEHCVPWDL